MISEEREPLLPLWEHETTSDSASKTEEYTNHSMILISVPAALESTLRAVAR